MAVASLTALILSRGKEGMRRGKKKGSKGQQKVKYKLTNHYFELTDPA